MIRQSLLLTLTVVLSLQCFIVESFQQPRSSSSSSLSRKRQKQQQQRHEQSLLFYAPDDYTQQQEEEQKQQERIIEQMIRKRLNLEANKREKEQSRKMMLKAKALLEKRLKQIMMKATLLNDDDDNTSLSSSSLSSSIHHHETLLSARLNIEEIQRSINISKKAEENAKALLEARLKSKKKMATSAPSSSSSSSLAKSNNAAVKKIPKTTTTKTMESLLTKRLSLQEIKQTINKNNNKKKKNQSPSKAAIAASVASSKINDKKLKDANNNAHKSLLEARLQQQQQQQLGEKKNSDISNDIASKAASTSAQQSAEDEIMLTNNIDIGIINDGLVDDNLDNDIDVNNGLVDKDTESSSKTNMDSSSSSSSSTASDNNNNRKKNVLFDEEDYKKIREQQEVENNKFYDDISQSLYKLFIDDDDRFLMNKLKERQKQLFTNKIVNRWQKCSCTTKMPITIKPNIKNEWIRRIDIDTYPYAICGTTLGSLYLIDIKNGIILDYQEQIHDPVGSNDDSSTSTSTTGTVYKDLYGNFDGLGQTCISIKDQLVLSAGREGGVIVWYIDPTTSTTKSTSNKLNLVGRLEDYDNSLDKTIITSIKFDNLTKNIYIAGYDGKIRIFNYYTKYLKTIIQPSEEVDDPIIDIDINEEINYGIYTTKNGSIGLFSLLTESTTNNENNNIVYEGGEIIDTTSLSSSESTFGRSILLMKSKLAPPNDDLEDDDDDDDDNDEEETTATDNNAVNANNKWFAIVGYYNGKMNMIPLFKDENDYFNFDIDNNISFNDNSEAIDNNNNSNSTTTTASTTTATTTTTTSTNRPKRYDRTKLPLRAHTGPVMCLTKLPHINDDNDNNDNNNYYDDNNNNNNNNIFLSGGQDTSIRVWEITYKKIENENEKGESEMKKDNNTNHNSKKTNNNVIKYHYYPKCLYVLSRYKLWLSNICISNNGLYLTSDGTDNTIVVRDFTPPAIE